MSVLRHEATEGKLPSLSIVGKAIAQMRGNVDPIGQLFKRR
jgi:hypothetical protein